MTTDHDALLAAILANRDDDMPRLAFADWCDENGQSERGEFIRCQIELVTTVSPAYREVIVDGIDWSDLETGIYSDELKRAVKLCRRIRELWDIGTICGGFLELPAHWGIPYWRRGFVESTKLSWTDWLHHADAITRAQPVERVKLTTYTTSDSTDFDHGLKKTTFLVAGVWVTIDDKDNGKGMLPVLRARWPRIEFELPPENHFAIRFQQSDSQEGPWTDIPANDQITAGYMRAVAQSAAPGEAVTIQYHPR